MSKAPAKAEAAEGEAPAKGGKKKLIIIIVAVLVLAIAGAGAFMMMGKKKHAEGEEAEEEAVSHEPPRSRWTLPSRRSSCSWSSSRSTWRRKRESTSSNPRWCFGSPTPRWETP